MFTELEGKRLAIVWTMLLLRNKSSTFSHLFFFCFVFALRVGVRRSECLVIHAGLSHAESCLNLEGRSLIICVLRPRCFLCF